VSRRVAPRARRELDREVAADTLNTRRARIVPIEQDGVARDAVVVRVSVGRRPEVAAWLEAARNGQADAELSIGWLFLPETPAALLLCAVGRPVAFRFNVGFAVGWDRRYVEALAESGILGLTAERLSPSEDGAPPPPITFLRVPTEPLRAFLRGMPPPPTL
jgi:hypothetical protein